MNDTLVASVYDVTCLAIKSQSVIPKKSCYRSWAYQLIEFEGELELRKKDFPAGKFLRLKRYLYERCLPKLREQK